MSFLLTVLSCVLSAYDRHILICWHRNGHAVQTSPSSGLKGVARASDGERLEIQTERTHI